MIQPIPSWPDRHQLCSGRPERRLIVPVLLAACAVLFSSLVCAAALPAGLDWDKDRGVVWQSPWGDVWLDRSERSQGPIVRFLPGGQQRLTGPAVERASPSQLRLTYRLEGPGKIALDIVREIRVQGTPPELALVETFTLHASQPLSVDVQIERPFSLQPAAIPTPASNPASPLPLDGRGAGGEGGGNRVSDRHIPSPPAPLPKRARGDNIRSLSRCKDLPLEAVCPLKNGWARTVPLAEHSVRAEYRLGNPLGTAQAELAIPLLQIGSPGHWKAALVSDPTFSTLFDVRRAGNAVQGSVSYRYLGSRVPIRGTETRRFGVWLSPAKPGEPFGAAVDAMFHLMLPDVPPGPQWLHEIAMVDYDYMSDKGLGWDRDVALLAKWLKPAERRRVALCLHGWYDALGSYCYDSASGRMRQRWLAFGPSQKIPMTQQELKRRLRLARQLGFRVLLYFADGMTADSRAPGFHEDWVYRDAQGKRISAWQGPDTFGPTFWLNPAHPQVFAWFLGYMDALLKTYGAEVDGFVWDETFQARTGQIALRPEPAYCDRAMLALVKELSQRVRRFDPQKVFLASDCLGVTGDVPGYAMVAHGTYQDTACNPTAWSYGLFPNWRNVLWSCNWGSLSNFEAMRWGVETFGVPVAISNGWGDDRGPSEWTTAQRDAFLALFRARLARTGRVRYLTEDPRALVARTQANRMVEIGFTAAQDYRDPFHEVTLDVLFEPPRGPPLKVPAFWAGGRVWKVRYASPVVGLHRWRSVCSVAADRGLHNLSGAVIVAPYRGDNPLYLHGPVRVASDRRHFEHLDKTPFFWLGDTWWMGLCRRLHWPDEFRQLAADRKAKGFNVIQIVAGLYPDMPAFDPRGANEAGFPWEKDYSRIRPEYFDQADRRLLYLVDQGFVPCIVGAWGYHLPWMGTERMKEHWRYLVARYGALPVVWCAAGEGTMPFYGSKRAKEEAALQKTGWSEVIRYIRAIDPFHRMITIHPSGSARETVTDASLLDFDMHQTGHAPESAIGQMARQIRTAYEARPVMPVIAGESSYEGLDLREWGGGVLSADASRQMFWTGLMHNGAAGGTYGANGIWQVNRRGAPYGPSPHGRSWGSIPWDDAMREPGSTQVGLAKRFFAGYPWCRLEPKPDSMAWADGQPTKNDIRPSAVGIGQELRIIYVPRARPIIAKQLAPQTEYRVSLFDPVGGGKVSLGKVKTDDAGSWRCAAPNHKHDWVLVLEKEALLPGAQSRPLRKWVPKRSLGTRTE